jgi:hypothetical protein
MPPKTKKEEKETTMITMLRVREQSRQHVRKTDNVSREVKTENKPYRNSRDSKHYGKKEECP